MFMFGDNLNDEQRRGAEMVVQRVTASIEAIVDAGGDPLDAACTVANGEIAALAARGYGLKVQEAARQIVAFAAAPIIAAAYMAEDLPDTIAGLDFPT